MRQRDKLARRAGTTRNREASMLRTAVVATSLAMLIQGASAATTTTGHSALALAALVASYSPVLNAHEKHVMARLLEGRQNVSFPAGKTISVSADSIICKAGDVDITARSCALTFGAKTINIAGRRANELYATMIEAEVPSDGAAGTIYESLTALACTIDPNGIKQNSGGGASCAYAAAP
jgi:hypothetical protein